MKSCLPTVTQVQKYAERYFGGWKGASDAVPANRASAAEPAARPEGGPGSFEEATRAGPAAVFAYYRPGVASEDSTSLDVVRRVLQLKFLKSLAQTTPQSLVIHPYQHVTFLDDGCLDL